LWFGWSGQLCDGEPPAAAIAAHEGILHASIPLPKEHFHRYYNGFANEALWPLFHYMPGKCRYRPEDRESYERVNRLFAERLQPVLKAGDCVWIHDYHLIPQASRLRELGVRHPIGFFLHIPFPHIEMLRVLPSYAELVRDLTAYDVVGFQTESDVDAFLGAVAHVFGEHCVVEHRTIRVGCRSIRCEAFPIGIDVESVQDEAFAASASDVVGRMLSSLLGRRLIVGADRLDYSKGLVERFKAYELFLEQFPAHRSRITYLQIAPLSRSDVQSYVEIRRALEQAAGRTNGRFAETDWTPIRYLNRNIPHETLMGLLRAAHVGLVTPLRDGMNLIAKEYIGAQDPEDPGVLILSNLTGAARELSAAILINPYDPHALGRALETALAMPLGERRERHAQMLLHLRRRSLRSWVEGFVAAMRDAPRAPFAKLGRS
jgi:trehalose 6-phosphate synthase